MRRSLPLLVALVLAALGCATATSRAFHEGEKAERLQDYDRAVLEYQRAFKLAPDNVGYRLALDRARLRAATEHTNTARRLVGRGLYKEALDEYRIALQLQPNAPGLQQEIADAQARASRGSETSIQQARARARERSLPGLDLGPEAQQPLGLVFRGASLREAYLALGRAVGINVTFDPSFQDVPVSLDLRDVGFEQALNALDAAGHTFHRVVDAKVLNVVPDTPAKRRDYEQQVVKTFFLSNAELKETIDLLRVVLGARRIAPVPGANALTINDTPDKVAAAERIVDMIDKRRAEVVVEVEILEVDRSRLKEYGVYITSGLDASGTQGVAAVIGPDPSKSYKPGDNPYSSANLLVTALPGAVVRLLESDSNTRLLANPQLRVSEGQTAQARFGDQVPVPVTTFTPIATGGTAQQPITSFEYKNVGVNIDITPRVHQDGEVTLVLKLDISSVGAPGYQSLPTFNSRTVNSTIRLRDGETNLLAGLILDNERHALTGLPGVASIPVIGRIFASNHDETTQTDIVMTLTPHVVRRTDITEQDLRSFPLGGESSPFVFDSSPPPVTPTQPSGPRPSEPPAPRVEPIRPPQGTPNVNPPS
ncbi:MAG TPA: secretin N-terminal domain-containing protein [Vicinamibacteria bacterium]|nr:secretin N-terminal domain-containing protein [Vicinamibacteria bacterium]